MTVENYLELALLMVPVLARFLPEGRIVRIVLAIFPDVVGAVKAALKKEEAK